MGHLVNPDRTYQLLQKRLDRNVTGAPDSPAFRKIVRILFGPEEAEVACHVPTRFVRVSKLATQIGMEEERLAEMLTGMARRGLVFDVEKDGVRRVALAPVVIGFFEFTFMRVKEDLPQKELAALFEQYFFEEGGSFPRAIFGGSTQLGRSLVRESALPEGDFAEVLDWERASRIVTGARTVGVSTCACRHHSEHLGKACDRPQRACLTLDFGAETLIRSGHAEKISNAEGMRILEECQAAGLAQTADNVKRNVGYICNCCGCCCGMMRSLKTFDLNHAIVSSNWIAEVDEERCKGCGLCVKACPVDALEVVKEEAEGGRVKRKAVRDAELCLGCGVCDAACKTGGMKMVPRPSRVFTPEDTFDRMVAMAIERGKLGELIMEDPDSLGWQALGRIVKALEAAPPVKAALAIEPLRSAFLGAALPLLRLGAGPVTKLMS